MDTINDIQDAIIEEFADFDDWMDRYAYIIDLGNEVPALDEQHKTPDNIIAKAACGWWLPTPMAKFTLPPTATP